MDAAAAAFAAGAGVRDFSVIIMRGEANLYRRDFGAYTPDTVLPIASATKWMTGALVMTLVDDGKLTLDDRLDRHLSALPPAYAELTLRQLLSYTAGTAALTDGAADLRLDRRLSFADAAAELARKPLVARPGESFAYG
jgi:CubicO group peptidase (beta-lactamase class C family)